MRYAALLGSAAAPLTAQRTQSVLADHRQNTFPDLPLTAGQGFVSPNRWSPHARNLQPLVDITPLPKRRRPSGSRLVSQKRVPAPCTIVCRCARKIPLSFG